jgi:preprotein translocase subunit SecB
MNDAKFQFQGFKISRSLIERLKEEQSNNISLNFSPSGTINKVENKFQLKLGVKIDDEEKTFNIEIEAIADYKFDKSVSKEELGVYFFTNAPALLFPYLRAYISTLTNLSGFKPINLPTLNMSNLGKSLKDNTTEI